MQLIVDSHTQIFPNYLIESVQNLSGGLQHPMLRGLRSFRGAGRSLLRPLSHFIHKLQPMNRVTPPSMRDLLDQLGAAASLPNLLFESSPEDLIQAMDAAGVHKACIVAHPPFASNEFILECAQIQRRFIPIVQIPPGMERSGQVLDAWIQKGARALKIHAAFDGLPPDTPHYHRLLASAREHSLAVFLHTGDSRTKIFYRNPNFGQAPTFEPWFKEYPEVSFVLAHCNFHAPDLAIGLAEKYSNLFLGTSWQPSEIIGEAVRRIGAHRVLFASDWPIVGDNLGISLNKIQDCIAHQTISLQDVALILGENAIRLLKGSEK